MLFSLFVLFISFCVLLYDPNNNNWADLLISMSEFDYLSTYETGCSFENLLQHADAVSDIVLGHIPSSLVIWQEARLPPNIGFTLGHDLAVFMHSAITLVKVNRFG